MGYFDSPAHSIFNRGVVRGFYLKGKMTILSATELREHIQTDLGDDALDRLANASEAMIIRTAGSATVETEEFADSAYPGGRSRNLYLGRPVASITSVKERTDPDDAQTTLAVDDFRLEGTRKLIRLREGTNPQLFWTAYVEVIYVPVVDTGLREHVQIELVKLALNYSGAKSEEDGEFDFEHHDTNTETQGILKQLRSGGTHRMVV